MIGFDDLKAELHTYDNELELYTITNDKIVFEESVKLNCFYCKNYDSNWTCPPRIPDLDYKGILGECENIAIILYKTNVNKENFETLRNRSTNIVHTSLLSLEKFLWESNYPLAITFIGGSCKLCKNGCSTDKCMNKGNSRIPVEALGINVVKTMKNINIDVVFPTDSSLMRCGMILW